jgi:putative glutamine amidotransferase
MIQHLPTAFRHSRCEEDFDKVHFCIANEKSWLAKLYGTRFPHNSAHHQAADRLGEGLVADSYCLEDGTLEAMHHKTLPVYGVQWHPERMCLENKRTDTVNGFAVFQFFRSLCGEGQKGGSYDLYGNL